MAGEKGCYEEFALIQQKLPVPDFPPMSDTECLNLNITVPNVQSYCKGLPVLVWVHGGALLVGSGTWPQYDFAALVRHSVELGTPFIGVTIKSVICSVSQSSSRPDVHQAIVQVSLGS